MKAAKCWCREQECSESSSWRRFIGRKEEEEEEEESPEEDWHSIFTEDRPAKTENDDTKRVKTRT